MSKHQCPYCGETTHFVVGKVRQPKGWAWWCGRCGGQGPARATEAEALASRPKPSLAQAMLPLALEVMEAVLTQGAKDHPPDDWREMCIEGNVFHAADHLDTAERRDEALWQEDHLAHALVRTAMAVQLREEGKKHTKG